MQYKRGTLKAFQYPWDTQTRGKSETGLLDKVSSLQGFVAPCSERWDFCKLPVMTMTISLP